MYTITYRTKWGLCLVGNLLYLLFAVAIWLVAFAVALAVCQVLAGVIIFMALIPAMYVLPLFGCAVAAVGWAAYRVYPTLLQAAGDYVANLPWMNIGIVGYEVVAIASALYLLSDFELVSIPDALEDVGDAWAKLQGRPARSWAIG